jgi:hypothetical protein
MRRSSLLLFPLAAFTCGNDPAPDTDDENLREEFACEELTCSGDEYCYVVMGGAPPPEGEDGIHPSCEALPEACADDPTCACLTANDVCGGGGVECTDTDGHPRCTLMAP